MWDGPSISFHYEIFGVLSPYIVKSSPDISILLLVQFNLSFHNVTPWREWYGPCNSRFRSFWRPEMSPETTRQPKSTTEKFRTEISHKRKPKARRSWFQMYRAGLAISFRNHQKWDFIHFEVPDLFFLNQDTSKPLYLQYFALWHAVCLTAFKQQSWTDKSVAWSHAATQL